VHQTLLPQLWPDTATIERGVLQIGGCSTVELGATHGTPLYVFDEATLRTTMRTFTTAFAAHYPGPVQIHYASKALLNTALAQIVAQEGLGIDVVSGAELLVARRAGLPLEHVHLHGNAKTPGELARAVEWGVGAIVVDNLDELDQLVALCAARSEPQGVLLRIAPNIDAQTHAHIATGGSAAKFGIPLEVAPAAAVRAATAPGLRLLGLHAHIGSQLFAAAELAAAVAVLVGLAAQLRTAHDITLDEISPGGGLGVPYTADMPSTDIDAYAATVAQALISACAAHGLPLPRLTVEPGRSIVARAGVALYRIVARKMPSDNAETPLFLHIDGGMADNIRPALYGARYTALLANRADAPPGLPVDVAGRYCESGDVVLRGVTLPPARPGDLLAVAVSGAYTLSMASTYNLVPRPAVLLAHAGQTRLIQRRETEADLLARDLPLCDE
jgi:diaminopimelate decarboxylase